MKNIVFTLLFFNALYFSSLGQSIEEITKTANSLNITTRQQAIEELRKRGVSENEARQLARMRGLDFDEYLENYLVQKNGDLEKSSTNSTPFLTIKDSTLVDESSITPTTSDSILNQVAPKKTESTQYFGYSIFKNNPFLSKEYLTGNIDENYLISPGDKLRILVFGVHTFEDEVEVDLNGNIKIGNFGVFQAAGNSFKTLKERLKIFLGRYYQNLLASTPSTFLDVSLTQIRPIKITVIGESNSPGAHLISGMASVLNALYSSGGIKESGSLRTINVIRNNKVIHVVDLYDFLTNGIFKEDIQLTNGDIIFVPSRISTVSLTGEVRLAGLFELLPGENLYDLFRFSGGLLPTASVTNISIARVKNFKSRSDSENIDRYLSTVTLNFRNPKEEPKFELYDGDNVKVYPILEKITNKVYISGNVNLEGDFSTSDFPNLNTLIQIAAKGLKPNTYLNKVDIFSEDLDGKKQLKTYSLNSILKEEVVVSLENQDSIRVYSEEEISGQKLIKVKGFINEPKTLFWRENFSIFDLIFQSAPMEELEFKKNFLSSRIDILRRNEDGETTIFNFSLDNLDELRTNFLHPNDELILYSKSVYKNVNPKIRVNGFVRNPTTIELTAEMKIEDAILQAGGFTDYADTSVVIVNREKFDYDKNGISERFAIQPDLGYLLGKSKTSSSLFILEPNDLISVRKLPGVESLQNVLVFGEVKFPGSQVLENKYENFNSIVEKAGGLGFDAYLPASYIVRDSSVIAVNLKQTRSLSQSFFKDGDQIFIEKKSGTVKVLGAVENESSLVWREGKRANYYIRNVGGRVKNSASTGYVIQKNGLAKSISTFKNPKIFPDSRIVVNQKEKVEKSKNEFVDSFIKVLTVLTGSLTTLVLVQNLQN
ncbi:MAG: SLBB domain-containing protein [Algoriphagus sp.]|nr:SLBB domain-containing protein [Algoriphagus sp.]